MEPIRSPTRTLEMKELTDGKNTRTVTISKISSTEEFPKSNVGKKHHPNANVDVNSVGGASDKKKRGHGGFLKSLLSPSRKNPQHSPGDLVWRERSPKRNFRSSVPCSAVKTDNNENILSPRLRMEGLSSGSGVISKPRAEPEMILQECKDQGINLKAAEAEYSMMISSPREVENMSAPTTQGKPSPKRTKSPGRKMEPPGRAVTAGKNHKLGKHEKHTHHDRLTKSSKGLDQEQQKLTFEKAALILYEDEKAKEQMKAEVAELKSSCEKYRYDLRKHEERSAQEILKLQRENETLLIKLSRAEESVNHWKSKYQRQGNEDVNLSRLKLVTKENIGLKEDLEVLKSVTRRLNQEMAFYQEKLRSKFVDPAKMPVFTSSSDSNANSESPARNDLTLPSTNSQNYVIVEPKKNLLPLLIAYDEVIAEKNEIIKDHEVALQKFKAKCHQIVIENEELHKVVGESKETGPIAMEEWKFLHDNAVMVLEENELLHDQCKILKSKAEIAEKTHEKNSAQLHSKIAAMEVEASKLKTIAKDAQEQCAFLTTQISKMNAVLQRRIPAEEHDNSIRECNRLFEELKGKYLEETQTLKEKLKTLEAEKERFANELTEIDAENAKLLVSLRSLEKLQSTSKSQLQTAQTELSNATKSKNDTAKAVTEIVTLVETVIAEREALRASFYEQQALNEQLMNLRKKETELVEDLRGKIQLMENVHHEEMEKYRNHITKLEDVLETVGERHQADVLQLKELIHEKSAHIEKLGIEKDQLMEDLETVWRATTRDASNSRGMPSPLLKKYNFMKDKLDK